MRFKQYLIEQVNKMGRHAITYQKLLHALDTSHITQKDDSYSFNLGTIVKDSTLKELNVLIKQGDDKSVRLGQKKDGSFVLVITVQELPAERTELDSMLSSQEYVMNGFVQEVGKYYSNHRDPNKEMELSSHEQTEQLSDPKTVEDNYNKLIAAIDRLTDEHGRASASLDGGNSVNLFKNASNELAKSKLKASYFGNDDSEFVKNMMKLPEAGFIKLLDKEQSKKILSRLQSYKEQMQ